MISSHRTKIFTEPAAEPVLLAEQKLHMRVEVTTDDAYITELIKAARRQIEHFTGRALVERTVDAYLNAFPAGGWPIVLPFAPLKSVGSVNYTPDGAAETAFAASEYSVDTITEPGQIVLKTDKEWPDDDLETVNGVRIRYVSGYGAAGANCPQDLVHAVKFLSAHFYENREAVVRAVGGKFVELPMAVQSIIASNSVREIG